MKSINMKGTKINVECDICNKIFDNRKDLRRHVDAVHEGKRDKKCNSCGKSFALVNTLNIHIKLVHERVIGK